MKKIVKQVVGIDVAQKELVVCLGRMLDDWSPELYATRAFPNTKKGFVSLVSWTKKLTDPLVELRYVMEATGVYHEQLAYWLDEMGAALSIVLPSKISSYFRTLEIKTITDKTSSEAIARFALERKLDTWKRPLPIFKQLRQLSREREQITALRTISKNQLHAEKAQAEPGKGSVARLKRQIALFDSQLAEIQVELQQLLKENAAVKQSVQRISSIKGIGTQTAAAVLGETNGFELIRSKRQLTSYAGLDVREKLSGTSVKGKPSISKRGNKHLRKAMYMPALSAVKHDQHFKALFARLVARHGIKMKALVAVQRKLLELMYILHKTQKTYDPNYQENQNKKLVLLNN